MENKVSPKEPESKSDNMMKTQRKSSNQKLKDRISGHRFAHRVKKSSTKGEDVDNDIILRMALPGYNWFEDQVKNNMYSSEGEKKAAIKRIITYPKPKAAIPTLENSKLAGDKSMDSNTKQKAPITKRVINSTLMLLPNTSLPLKKRKIRNVEEITPEVKITSKPQKEDAKKICNPPIQKVIPILNNSKAILIEDSPKPLEETKTSEPPEPSAVKSDPQQKKPLNMPYYYQNHPYNYSLDMNHQHQAFLRKNISYPPLDLRQKFQSPSSIGTEGCHRCNLFRYQNAHLNQLHGQDPLKQVKTFPPNQTITPNRNYWPSNLHQNFSPYDPHTIPESGMALPRAHPSLNTFNPLNAFLHPDNTYHNPKSLPPAGLVYGANHPWDKVDVLSYKQIQMNYMPSDFKPYSGVDRFGNVTVSGQPYPLYMNRYHPI